MLREYFWRTVTVAAVKRSNVLQPHSPPSDDDYVKPIPMSRRYPGLGSARIFVSEYTPISERESKLSLLFLHALLRRKEYYGLTEGYPEIWKGTGAPYPTEYLALAPAPELPEDFHPDADKLAGVARRGPFSVYTRQDSDGTYVLDLRHIEALQPRSPFIRVGGLARFGRAKDGSLTTLSIESQGRTFKPGKGWEWAMAEKRILVGLNTHATLIDHLTHMHVASAGTWAICTHLAFSPRHPLRVLLQPFVVETMRVNNDNIHGLILSEHSNVPSYSGYPLVTINNVIRRVICDFDVRYLDAEHRARVQGQLDDPTFPTVQSVVTLWRMFRDLTQAWCEEHLPEIDLETRIWCEELDHRVPNGVRKLLGIDDFKELKIEHVAHLLAVGMFAASVWHHVVADLTRDYMMQFHLMPPAINANGYPTRGIVLEKMNSIAIAGLLRYKLLDNTVHLPAGSMRKLWGKFQDGLKEYEEAARREPSTLRYRVMPSRVPSSIHA